MQHLRLKRRPIELTLKRLNMQIISRIHLRVLLGARASHSQCVSSKLEAASRKLIRCF